MRTDFRNSSEGGSRGRSAHWMRLQPYVEESATQDTFVRNGVNVSIHHMRPEGNGKKSPDPRRGGLIELKEGANEVENRVKSV